MKKLHIRIISMVLAWMLTVGLLPVQAVVSGGAEADSILYNGSFDLPYIQNQTVSGWDLNTNNPNHTTVIQSNVIHGTTGNALKITATGQSYIWAEDFSVEAGEMYILSYYVRVDAAKGLSFAPFLNDSYYQGGWWKDYVISPVTGVTDGWVKISGAVVIPDSVGENVNNPDSKVQLGFKVYAGSGTFYLDDVSVIKTEIQRDNPNLSFEENSQFSDAPLNWQSGDSGISIQSDKTVYHDGSSSMYVSAASLKEKNHVDSQVHIPVKPGMVYEYSFWMCSRNASPTATLRMDLELYRADGSRILAEDGTESLLYGTVAALNSGTERSGWTQVVTRAVPPTEAAYVQISFTLTRGSAELWIDDIFLEVVEDGTDCVVYYEDFHAVDEKGNISTWQNKGGSFTAENGGKLTVTDTEAYLFTRLSCLETGHTYCIKGKYSADIGGKVQLRFFDYQNQEYIDAREVRALQTGENQFALEFTAPSHTYAQLWIGSDQTGTILIENVTVYMTAEPPEPNRNYLNADWSVRADRENVVSSVEVYNGIPTLMIDGQPTAAYLYQRPDLDAYLQTDAESRIVNSGIDLYVTYGGNLYKGGCAPIWLEDGSVDYNAFDAVIYDTLAGNDDALVMVNIGLFAPKWWLDKNPGQEALAYNGSEYIALGDVSLASEQYRQEAGQVLRQLLRHMKEQPYYNRVFGLKISGGQSYEWMCLGTGSDQGPDYSEASKVGFRTYLKNKYGTDAALQAAWKNAAVTLETAAAPSWDERCAASNVYMGSGSTLSRNMVDWNLWLSEASTDSFLYYCQIAKEETDNQIIVGGYNGYLWTSNSYDSQGMAHTAMDRVLDSPYVDWIASPIAYNERLLGQSSTYMALLDSVQAHGKLYIAELDNRTCLSDSYTGNNWDANRDYMIGQTRTMADTIYQQKRDFANALVNGAGLWQFDMYGGWLDDEQLYQYFRDAKEEYDLSVHLDRDTTNEVAVFVGDESYAYLTAENDNMSFMLLEPMLMQQRKHLAAMGAGYDTYAMSSLLEGKVPSHKLNIILSPFEITEDMHNAIDTHLKKNGQVVVWVYLPGISTGNELSASNVERATGFAIGVSENQSILQVKLTESGHSLSKGLNGLSYGSSNSNLVSPIPYIRDLTDVAVLGYHVGSGTAGLGVKDMGDWTSVYSAAPCLDVALLRNLMAFAGCHSYSDNLADIIYSSNHYVALHSAVSGEKTINLSGNYSVYDVFEGEFLSMNTNRITYYHQENDTHIFRLMPPSTYAVTASIQSGKGTLSAPGLTFLTQGQPYSLNIKPEIGYQIAGITVNGDAAVPDENGVLALSAVNENTVIEVFFCKEKLTDNWDFELGSFGGGVTGSGTATVISDTNVHSGLYSLRLNHDGTARDLLEMTVYMRPCAESRTLTVTFWAKTAARAVQDLRIGAHFFTESWNRTGDSVYDAIYPSRNQWQEFTREITVPAGTEIFQYLFYTDARRSDIYIDDISMTCDGQQMVINGGFERGNLTGSFTSFENTPQIIRTQIVHSGNHSARLTAGGSVFATTAERNTDQPSLMELSAWLYIPANGGSTVSYRVCTDDGDQLAAGSWSLTEGQWEKKSVQCVMGADAQTLCLELSVPNDSTAYVDDIQIAVKEWPKIGLSFQEIYSDGTWRFGCDAKESLTEEYYKLPVILDGVAGYVAVHNSADMLQIYPDFFGVYGGSIPIESFVIPQGAALVAVSPAQQWQETDDVLPVQTQKPVFVNLTDSGVKNWNLSMGGDIAVNFRVQAAESIRHSAGVRLTVAGQSTQYALTDGVFDEAGQTYCFTTHLAAAQMTEPICVEVLFNGRAVSSQVYTVRGYCDELLKDESYSKYHTLVKEMLTYGGAAQSYFGYNLDALASTGISGTADKPVPGTVETEMSVDDSVDNLDFYGASVIYREKLALRLYFKGNVENIDFGGCQPIEKNGMYYVEFSDILPQNLDQQFTVTVTDSADEKITVSYSPMNYIVRMYAKGDSVLQTLMQALYNYHLVAKQFCTVTD